jgi:hypothetical protein
MMMPDHRSHGVARTHRSASWIRAGIAGIALVSLVACAQTRTVTPVAITQPGDEALSCPQLDTQIHDNEAAAVQFARQATKVESNNDAYKVATIFVTLAAIGVDLSKEDQIKARSLQDRNEYLQYLKAEKKCST